MRYPLPDIARVLQVAGEFPEDRLIDQLLTDSRKLLFPDRTLFFALEGPRRSGVTYVEELYDKGVRCFVAPDSTSLPDLPGTYLLQVPDVLKALQHLAAWHRSRFTIPVIGITGSNGKTMVKEWLYQLLQPDEVIIRSPRSYNSQTGVPLSVWQMEPDHTLAIFEAGVSMPGEMINLQTIIQPTIGIFTNIGEAHAEGFDNDREKAIEKAILFKNTPVVVYAKDSLQQALNPEGADKYIFPHTQQFISWSRQVAATLLIQKEESVKDIVHVTGLYKGKEHTVSFPFSDRVSVDNAITCWAVLLYMGYPDAVITERLLSLQPVEMRMQLKKALHQSYLLNDSYNNDPGSLQLALDYLVQQAGKSDTTVILSDMLQTGRNEEDIYRQVAAQLAARKVHRLIGIGPAISRQAELLKAMLPGSVCFFYPDTSGFLQVMPGMVFRDEYILLKGARPFAFERISAQLEEKLHQTVMEISLSAMAHNLKIYREMLEPATKLMVMVKAFSYGSGAGEVGRLLQFHRVDYLAVAYTDEGIELRQAGINLPVMVMNADEVSFEALVNNQLEPEIYSFPVYHSFHRYLQKQGMRQYPVHIKFNTGMNRLGFEISEAAELAKQIQAHHTMMVKSVFSHLAASESVKDDAFTEHQVQQLQLACAKLQAVLAYPFIRHIANSAAIFRQPAYQLDMVRLGIGLYGVEASGSQKNDLQTVATLKTTIAQLRQVPATETIGYNRKGVLSRDSLIATVRIGYADGFPRSLGLGKAGMYVRGHIAPVIGQVCMDMTMLDVTDVPGVQEGDEVEVFGEHIPVQQVAMQGGTIPYEILTGISQRVKRVYLEE